MDELILPLGIATAFLFVVTLCAIFLYIPFCAKIAQNVSSCIFISPEDSHLDIEPESQIFKYKYQENIKCSKNLTAAHSQLTLNCVITGQHV